MSLIIYFPSSLFNQIHFKKVFLSIFSPKFSIHHISTPNKYIFLFFSFFLFLVVIVVVVVVVKSSFIQKLTSQHRQVLAHRLNYKPFTSSFTKATNTP